MLELAAWLQSLPFGKALRQLDWLVPWLQIVHILANGLILSAVIMIGMRAWGISRSQASVAMARRFQPWIWAGMVVLTVSGILLILYAPRRLLTDLSFQVKMVAMVAAMVATFALQLALGLGRQTADGGPGWPKLAGALAALTLVLWVGVTLAGRGRWLVLLLR